MAEYLDVGVDGAVRVDESAGVAKVWLVTSPGGANLGLPRLRALIAELTRRAALLAGEAGEAPAVAGVSRNLRARLRAMAGAPDVEARAAALADGVTVLLGALDAAEMMIADARRAPARTAEDERADVVAFLAPSRTSQLIAEGRHVGASIDRWGGPGYYAGRDTTARSVTLYADAPAALARVGAAAGVARWSGPHASLADAGKALDEEGGK